MNHKVILSIAIPTWNRGKYVKKCVENLLQFKRDEIEIIAIDNDSKDDTEEVLREVKDSRFRYYKNEKNIGSQNYYQSFMYAKGDFTYIAADKDGIDVKMIDDMIENIKKYNNLSYLLYSGVGTFDRIYHDAYYLQGSDALLNIACVHGYAGGHIFKTEYVKDIISKYPDAINDRFYSFPQNLSTALCTMGDALVSSKILYTVYDVPARKEGCMLKRPKKPYSLEPEGMFEEFTDHIAMLNCLDIEKEDRIYMYIKLLFQCIHGSTIGVSYNIKWLPFSVYYNRETVEDYLQKVNDYDSYKTYEEMLKRGFEYIENHNPMGIGDFGLEIKKYPKCEAYLVYKNKKIDNDIKNNKAQQYVDRFMANQKYYIVK